MCVEIIHEHVAQTFRLPQVFFLFFYHFHLLYLLQGGGAYPSMHLGRQQGWMLVHKHRQTHLDPIATWH